MPPVRPEDFMPDLLDNFPGYFRGGMQELGVPPNSRLGRFAGGVADDLSPALSALGQAVPAARFAAADPLTQARMAGRFLLEEQPDPPATQGPVEHRADPQRPDLRSSQHPRQRELDEREQQFNIEQEAKERQAQLRAGMTQYGSGVFGKREAGQGRMTSAFGRMHPTVSTGGQVSFMQSSGTPAADAREQQGRQEVIFSNRLRQQEEASALTPIQQARIQASSRYRPDAQMQMFQVGMAVAQRYSRDIEAINAMQGLSEEQRAAALESLNGQYEPYFRVLGLARGVSVPAFGGYGPGME